MNQKLAERTDPGVAARRDRDVAYGCFAAVLLVVWGLSAVMSLPMTPDQAEGYGMLLGSWAAVMLLGAGGVALVYSIKLWREWPLPVSTVLCLSAVLIFLREDEGKVGMTRQALIWYVVCSLAIAFFCIRWFGHSRKQMQLSGST